MQSVEAYWKVYGAPRPERRSFLRALAAPSPLSPDFVFLDGSFHGYELTFQPEPHELHVQSNLKPRSRDFSDVKESFPWPRAAVFNHAGGADGLYAQAKKLRLPIADCTTAQERYMKANAEHLGNAEEISFWSNITDDVYRVAKEDHLHEVPLRHSASKEAAHALGPHAL